jgi:DNA-binding transcriptional ArsR family regulator
VCGKYPPVPHPSEHDPAARPLAAAAAESLAESLRAVGTVSRLRLLWALLDGEQTVDELAVRAALSPSAASQQLRVLRQGRLVAVRRSGRHAHYRRYDHHVPDLLAALRHHHEHAGEAPSGGAAGRDRAGDV